MYKIDGKQYNYKYTIQRISMIEQAIGTSLVGIIAATKGILSLEHLKILFAYGMLGEDGIYIPLKKGMEFAEKVIEKEGLIKLSIEASEALLNDCPFLFQAT